MSINRAILLGNVGRDPEIRTMGNGDKVATFSIATSERWKDKTSGVQKEATEWHTIVVYNQNLIPVVEQYVKKGTRVGIEGMIKTRKWQAQDGSDRWSTEIVIGRFDGRLSLEGQPQGAKRTDEHGYGTTITKEPPASAGARPPLGKELDDDIPF